ncbi:MAG: hypothetical protein ACI4YB_04885 [Oscillospiraceae bacterium]
MRITQNFADRKYLKNSSKLLSNYTKSMLKIESQMDYFRASENAINASKALTVRKNLQDLGMYDSNLKLTKGLYEAAEQNLYTVANKVFIEVSTKLDQACNGTYSQDQLNIIAHELDQYAESALTTLNADYAERRLFGGTNNSSPAFATLKEDDGITDKLDPVTGHKIVTYNGVPVDDITADGAHYMKRITKAEYDAKIGTADAGTVVRVAYDQGYDEEIDQAEYDEILNGNGTIPADPDSVRTETHDVKTEVSADEYDPNDSAYSTEDGKFYKTETVTKYYKKNYRYYTGEAATEEEFNASKNDGSIVNIDGKYIKTQNVNGCKPIYVDIGLGIKYNAEGEVQVGTAVDVSMNGAKITGTGFTTINSAVNSNYNKDDPFSKASYDMQFSNNFVQLIYDAADALRAGDVSRANATIDLLDNSNTGILTEITTLGAKYKSTEFYLEKDEEYKMSLQERQNDVEGCDMTQEITNMNATQAAYNAMLQLSANVLPKSIFDFI